MLRKQVERRLCLIPAFSAILACSGVLTSMMTPPLNISANPSFVRFVFLTAPSPTAASRPLVSAAVLSILSTETKDKQGLSPRFK